jgi:CheY-like chemotaxis protein
MSPDGWPNLKGVHVFVIDDNEDSRRLLQQALEYCGALVTTFGSPQTALQAMVEYIPTLVISDISMPEMTGIEFLRRVRARPPQTGGRIPAIALTAFYEDFAASAARSAGFEAYLTKPVNFETLCMVVDRVAGAARHTQHSTKDSGAA